MRRTTAVTLAALLAMCAGVPAIQASSRNAPLERLEASARGALTIEPDGSVSDLELPPQLEPPLRELYERAIKSWRFEPVEVDGRVVRAVGHMDLGLYIEFRGDDLVSAGIDRVEFLDSPAGTASIVEGARMRLPDYPPSLAARGIGGRVLLQIETDAEGRVVRAAVVNGALFVRADGAEPGPTRRAFAELVDASERAASRWVVPQCPGVCRVPLIFTPWPASGGGFWNPVVNVPHIAPAWVIEGGATATLVADGRAPSSTLRLREPFEGVDVVDGGE